MKQAQQNTQSVISSIGKENLNGSVGKKAFYFYDPNMNLQQNSKTTMISIENRPFIKVIYGGCYNYQYKISLII